METCPYCGAVEFSPTQDHVFPQFLGGSRKIRCCKGCNDLFGHSFEGATAHQFNCFQVYISSWGISLRNTGKTWKRAHTEDGREYDFRTRPGGVTPILSRPIVK